MVPAQGIAVRRDWEDGNREDVDVTFRRDSEAVLDQILRIDVTLAELARSVAERDGGHFVRLSRCKIARARS
jgi:hypothetical protein